MSQKFDALAFRQVMGQFATGITVVTAVDREGRNCGITVNSFTSVSLDPPLILVCVDNRSEFLRAISEADSFGVNILAAEQEELSRRFAARSENKFAGVAFQHGPAGAPLLHGTLATLECSRFALLPGGDHQIVLGKVEHLEYRGGEPLLYFGSLYRWLQS